MQASGYEFSAAPRSVATQRVKPGRDASLSSTAGPQNIMYDKRVHRGSAYVTRDESVDVSTTDTLKKKKPPLQRPPVPTTGSPHRLQRPITPPPVEGRFHMDIQTDTYLEELTDRNPEVDVDTQTDALLDLHAPITFIPLPSGCDQSTQIEIGDLFDFDLEVEPILEVLVGKTLELGLLEVMEENELNEIRYRQAIFEQARNAEVAEVQRLEAEAKRKYGEKQRRLDEETRRLAVHAALEEKVAARAYAKQYLADLHTHVFDTLIEQGTFIDPIYQEIREVVVPNMIQQASKQVHEMEVARKLVEMIVLETLTRRL